MSQVRQYELVYIMSPEATEQEVTDLHTQIDAIITRYQGELVKTENWGRRKLAFRIGKHREGTYVLEVFKGSGECAEAGWYFLGLAIPAWTLAFFIAMMVAAIVLIRRD